MTWSETKRAGRHARRSRTCSSRTRTADLPWTDEYAELFGDRDGLVTALPLPLAAPATPSSTATRPSRPGTSSTRGSSSRTRDLLQILDRAAARAQGGDVQSA